MACGSCGRGRADKPIFAGVKGIVGERPAETQNPEIKSGGVLKNIAKAAVAQPNLLKWVKDGVSGLLRCVEENVDYSVSDVIINREECKKCEFSTKDGRGNTNISSQCMAPDPSNNNAPCGCFILCKTQVGTCPLNKWKTTQLTISKNL